MTGACHWESILNPQQATAGYGVYSDAGQVIDASSEVINLSPGPYQPPKQVIRPASGGVMPYTSYTGGETPDPLYGCGYSAPG